MATTDETCRVFDTGMREKKSSRARSQSASARSTHVLLPIWRLIQTAAPLVAELLQWLARELLPQRFAVSPLAHGGVHLSHNVLVVRRRHPVEKVPRYAIARVVLRLRGITNFRATRFRFVQEPADVVGDAFDHPAGILFARRIAAFGLTVVLHDVHHLVHDRPARFAFEILPEPFSVADDPATARICRNSA